MAIKLKLRETESLLFCASKWWGDPDMPPQMEYPTITMSDDGEEFDCPLTFICQINCEDIAPFDKEDLLPHEGMLYFFAAMDEYVGYELPEHFGEGFWRKGSLVVKYAKSINMETFNSCIIVDDNDQELAEKPLAIDFSICSDDEDCIRLLGNSKVWLDAENNQRYKNLLQIVADEHIDFASGCMFNVLMKDSDLHYGNWKRSVPYMSKL